jgi:hypothetical protein
VSWLSHCEVSRVKAGMNGEHTQARGEGTHLQGGGGPTTRQEYAR